VVSDSQTRHHCPTF